jgi:hypothetical protein
MLESIYTGAYTNIQMQENDMLPITWSITDIAASLLGTGTGDVSSISIWLKVNVES